MRGPLSNHIIVHLARINDRASPVYKEAVKVIRARGRTLWHHPDDEGQSGNSEMESGLQQENHGLLKTQRKSHGVRNLSDGVIRILAKLDYCSRSRDPEEWAKRIRIRKEQYFVIRTTAGFGKLQKFIRDLEKIFFGHRGNLLK